MKGRTIKIHLIEGTPNDIMTAEIIASWTGKVILAPRTKLAELAKRPEVQRAGVYILVGDDPDYPAKERVYIGESENVFVRLKQHFASTTKDFWNHTIVVISKDEHLTKSLVRYLESRLIQIVAQARRASLDNGSAPDCPKLPESDVADMEYFLQQIQMLLPVLGFSFILPAPAVTVPTATASQNTQEPVAVVSSENSPVFQMNVAGTDAKAQEVSGEFVIFKGSTAKSNSAPALGRGYAELRKQLFEEGKLAVSGQEGFWTFTDNVPFSSPSAAAAVVAGTNRSGPETWQVQGTQQTYKQWQQAQVDAQQEVVVSDTSDEENEDEENEDEENEIDPFLSDEPLSPNFDVRHAGRFVDEPGEVTVIRNGQPISENQETLTPKIVITPNGQEFDETAYDIIDDLGMEMDLMENPMGVKWRAFFTQEAYDIVKNAPQGYIYEKDGQEYVKVWENEVIPFIIDMRVAGIDNSIPEQDAYSPWCRREIDE